MSCKRPDGAGSVLRILAMTTTLTTNHHHPDDRLLIFDHSL